MIGLTVLILSVSSCLVTGLTQVRVKRTWDSYIDNLIAQSKDASGVAHCSKACIIGLDGGAKWTSDSHANAFQISASEASTVASAFKSGDFTTFSINGVNIDSVKYLFLREEDKNVVYAKKKDSGAVTLQKSKTAIVIGYTPEGKQQGNCNKGVSVIAEYLEGLGL